MWPDFGEGGEGDAVWQDKGVSSLSMQSHLSWLARITDGSALVLTRAFVTMYFSYASHPLLRRDIEVRGYSLDISTGQLKEAESYEIGSSR